MSDTFVQPTDPGYRLNLSANDPGALDGPRMRIHPQWFLRGEQIAKRIQKIIIGNSYAVLADRDKMRWHFDPGNNWWLHLHPETNEIHLCYRYGRTDDEWQALKVVIEMFLT